MAYVITGACAKDEHCIDTCPVNRIHPTKDEPGLRDGRATVCIDCGACIRVCPTTSIFNFKELPAELQEFVQKNAAYFN
jgi:NAD-dependent dihydropyrimidine dehydrogenase PreA subunit